MSIRSTQNEKKLNSLVILNIEAEIFDGEKFGFKQSIEKFSLM